MSRRSPWLLAFVAALLVAIAAMTWLRMNSAPATGSGSGDGSTWGTSGALLLLIVVAAASARRRRKRKDDRDNG